MIITKRLMGKAIATWLGPTGEAARRAVAEVKERVTGTTKKLELYFDIAEPWSYLAAQVTSRLLEAYPVELEFHAITPPASDVDPFPVQRAKHAVRDAQQLADFYDLDFPGKREADSGSVRDFGTVLVRERPARDQLKAALELGHAMWSNDKKALTKLIGAWGSESHGTVAPILNASYSALRKRGHYMGAMLAYGGEWYWGVDRLRYLEAALARDTGKPVANVVHERPLAERGAQVIAEPVANKPPQPLACELWFSFRSPYSYLALEQIEGVLAPYAIPLKLRAVPPLVMRGAKMPTVKQMYIVRDVKREADRLGIPFGEICDPLGAGIDRCIALAYWADSRGALLPFAKSALRGIWAEARDVGEYVDLRFIVERAGLPWDEAREALNNPEAPKWAQAATTDMAVHSLWGVPSFKLGDFVAWGQDRLPILADRLRRNAAATTT
ncbi:MAG TPA: DsbA family protein [Kofleriaceae bacterium]|jgi:2-hydroxychromene-2-carboxylate isomerase|nr:DsbA family protein [Kofleriaceae bacterium]